MRCWGHLLEMRSGGGQSAISGLARHSNCTHFRDLGTGIFRNKVVLKKYLAAPNGSARCKALDFISRLCFGVGFILAFHFDYEAEISRSLIRSIFRRAYHSIMPQRYRKPSVSDAYPPVDSPPRKWIRYAAFTILFITIIVALTASSPETARGATEKISKPFGPAVHQPPIPSKKGSEEAKWFSDWKWLNQFSDSIRTDDKSVLPPLRERPPIYAFYDTSAAKDEATRAAENKLLLIWRRAWWAQGFKPVILGKAEAMNNELYQRVQPDQLDAKLLTEAMKWLAWEQMGGGILANWLLVPMGPRDDDLLSFLRRGRYPHLTRYEGLGGGLYSGSKGTIKKALTASLASERLPKSKSVTDQFPLKTFKVDAKPPSIAFYEGDVLKESYKSISANLANDKPAGLQSLAELITSHLHLTFLNTFSNGFAILTPFSKYTRTMSQPALALAYSLATCPDSPLPSSCPPNRPTCAACSSSNHVPVATSPSFYNNSNVYTIAVVPHPYTLTALLAPTKDITIAHIRRYTARDRWLEAITEETLGREISGPGRIVSFKETVASEWGSAHGFWITEDPPVPEHRDLEWHFGFVLPFVNTTDVVPKKQKPSEKDVKTQTRILDKAKDVLKKKRKKGIDINIRVRDAAEAWNLADTEAWKFVRALGAREVVKRRDWEAEEKKFAGGEGDAKQGNHWGRWFDKT